MSASHAVTATRTVSAEPRFDDGVIKARLQRPKACCEVRDEDDQNQALRNGQYGVLGVNHGLPALNHPRCAHQPHELEETEDSDHAHRLQ